MSCRVLESSVVLTSGHSASGRGSLLKLLIYLLILFSFCSSSSRLENLFLSLLVGVRMLSKEMPGANTELPLDEKDIS